MKRSLTITLVLALTSLCSAQQSAGDLRGVSGHNPGELDGLPRYMTAEEKLLPLPLSSGLRAAPTGTVFTPGEYEPVQGALVNWGNYNALLTEFVVGMTNGDPGAIAYIVVSGSSEQSSATSTLTTAGADMDRVEWLTVTTDTVWIRDYGPRFIYEDSDRAIIDHTYNRPRYNDNAFPSWLGAQWGVAVYLMDLTHGGGNFHCVSTGDAFMSTLILEENTDKTEAEITTIIESHFNVNLTIYERLASNVDATGHIDMWMVPLSDTKILVSEFGSGLPGYTQTEAAVTDLENRGYTVYRTPGWNSGAGGTGGTHYTYTNSAIVNDQVFIPQYGGSYTTQDATAVSAYQAAMPGYEIVQVDCAAIIPAAGAIHCVMKHVYMPLCDGDEDCEDGNPCTDDTCVAQQCVFTPDDANSCDDGLYCTGTETCVSGSCQATGDPCQPDELCDEDTDTCLAVVRTVYDFTGITSPSSSHKAEDGEIDVADSMIESGTFPARRDSINGWANWAEATSAEYAALVGSDDNRYQTADPGSGDNAAMIFQFTIAESPADIVQVDVSVEVGRASSTDLGWVYIWNYATSSYLVLGSQSGTADQTISAGLTSNPGDYVETGTGQLTIFVVNEDDSDWIWVDDISVTTTVPVECHVAGDCDDDNVCTIDTCVDHECQYAFAPDTTECRASAGVCDAADYCTGSSADCPADAKEAQGTECRAAAGLCDAPEECDGVSDDCPADAVQPDTYECRASAGVCDVAETCDGITTDCPTNGFEPDITECRAAVGDCDVAETCTGSAA
ncbi:MAG TPA: agmatine deiminase family protein, partial [Phycisphaerae bacterium]|nr:agmatine deiminase family protein [Phycisphaerae bacterium]